ncbi:MAG: EamA family transporter [Candidatus Omnitrophica bacterium]|nr:EamA family transporter [Candidatus Omnitrophota bacterium]
MFQNWKLFAFASAVFAGLTAVLAKLGVKNIPSNYATLFRTVVIVLFLSFLAAVRREWLNPFSLDRKSLIFLVLSGLATGLSWLCYFKALQLGPASLVAPIDKLSLVFVVMLSVAFLGEHLGPAQWLGVFLMSSGAILIALK